MHFIPIYNCEKPLHVVYAVNAGGEEHTDKNGIRFEADPLHGQIGIESDFGKQLMMIGNVPRSDEILYQTERYHTETFGYDVPVDGDGEYVLILKFCEVYFDAPNKKVFDVLLNKRHTIISGLDIFAQVGKGTAYDEHIYFTISEGKLNFKGEESEIRKGKIRIDFVKGNKDNPKINAFALLKGNIPKMSGQSNIILDGLVKEVTHEYVTENLKTRKTSGPKHPNPYSTDDMSLMIPVVIAVGAFIPLLFCLCKL